MQKIFHPENQRGSSKLDWLDSKFSFSFANWYNPLRMGFGALRVINDDIIKPKSGFGFHAHENMEIVTIVNEGVLRHQDSLGSNGEIFPGEVQIMSAGTGIVHSEFNPSKDRDLKLFQIWVMPGKYGVLPRYDQKKFSIIEKDKFVTLVSPNGENASLVINQQAYFSQANHITKDIFYSIKNSQSNGVYFFLIEGEINVVNQTLNTRDALGLWDFEGQDVIKISPQRKSKLLAIEVPMTF